MDIGKAVKAMREGARVARPGWNGKGMWVALQTPDAHSKMSEPYVYMKTAPAPIAVRSNPHPMVDLRLTR